MIYKIGRRARILSAGSLLCIAAMNSLSAQAQETETKDSTQTKAPADDTGLSARQAADIVVTGTLIRGIAPVSAPVIPLSRTELERSGALSLTDALATVPQIASLGGNQFTSTAGNSQQNSRINLTAARATNLRGLGPSATLVLVDGHRPAVGNQVANAFFDLDAIPSIAIGRIEVVADGASALYGSDAVAGVVNLVLRRNYDGVEVATRYGFNGDIHNFQASGILGQTWNGGSFMIAAEHYEATALKKSDTGNLFSDDLRPFGLTPPPTLAYPGNIIAGNNFYPIPAGQNGSNLLLSQLQAGTPHYRESFEDTEIVPNQNRNSVIMTLRQALTDDIEFNLNGHFSRRDFDQARANVVSAANGLSVPSSNPFSPCNPAKSQAGNPGLNCAANLNVLYSFSNDLGVEDFYGFQRNWGGTASLSAEIFADWKVTGSYGHYENTDWSRSDNLVNSTAVNIALGNTVSGVSKPANVPYLNPFCGTAGSCNSAATLDYIRAFNEDVYRFRTDQFQVQGSGSLFPLPGGAVRLAIGADYHRDRLDQQTTTNVSTPSTTVASISGGHNNRSVKAAYAELFVPIVGQDNSRPGIERLSLSLAGRIEDYSDFGTTKNPKLGLAWEPTRGIRLRGSYGTSFRAPTLANIADTFGNRTTPNNIVGTQIGLTDPRTLSIINRGGGGSGLGPEKATTWSIGIDTTPAFISGLTTSVNYFNIRYKDVISNPPLVVGFAGAIAASPLYDQYINYNPAFYPGRATMTQAEFNAFVTALLTANYPPVTRAPPPLALVAAVVDGRAKNAGAIHAGGFDFSTRYVAETGFGQWRLGVSGTYLLNWKTAAVADAPMLEKVNRFGYPLRFTARGEAGLTYGGFDLGLFLNYRNAYRIEPVFLPRGADPKYERIKSYTTVDLHLAYNSGEKAPALLKNITLALDVQNLFDRDPPLVLNGGLIPIQFDPANASPFGRMTTISLRKAF